MNESSPFVASRGMITGEFARRPILASRYHRPRRGPEIAGTRITAYDILDYSTKGWHASSIAIALELSTEQVEAALGYIDEHPDQVMAEYQEILDRAARGNPPELQERLDADHERFMHMVRERRQAKSAEGNGARNPGRR